MLDTPKPPAPRSKFNDSLPQREFGYNFIVSDRRVLRGERAYFWPRLEFIIDTQDGGVDTVNCDALDDYFEDFTRFKHKWRRNAAVALGLFSDYAAAKLRFMGEAALSLDDEQLARALLRGFAHALRDGTIPTISAEPDPLGLRWHSRGERQARVLVGALNGFLLWFGDQPQGSRWSWFKATSCDFNHPTNAFRHAAELAIRRKKSLLAHLDKTGEPKPKRHPMFLGILGPQKDSTRSPLSFPIKYAAEFVYKGFDLYQESQRTAATVAALLFLGGFRASEPLHLYVSDVQFAHDKVYVFLQDPTFGKVLDENNRRILRSAYLKKFELEPRDRTSFKRGQSGWKGMDKDEFGTFAHWLPIPALRKRVRELLEYYVRVTRPAIMSRRPRHLPDHPYLFVTAGLNGGDRTGEIGDPLTMSAFLSQWTAALNRLAKKHGDPELLFKKEHGTTLHGPRHLYGKLLKSLGIKGEVIMECMHHRDIRSHLVYGRLSHAEVDQLLQRAANPIPEHEAAAQEFMRDIDHISDLVGKMEHQHA